MTVATTSDRPVALIAMGQAAVKATQIVVALVAVRLVTEQVWNELAFLLSIHLAVVTFGGIGMQHTLLFFLADETTSPRRIVGRTFGVVSVFGALIAVVLWTLAPAIGAPLGVGRELRWLAIGAAFELAASCVQPALVALRRFRAAATWDIAGSVVMVSCIVVAAGTGGTPAVAHVLLATGAAHVLAAIVVIARLPHPAHAATMPRLVAQMTFAAPLGLTLAAGVMTRSIDKWFITAFNPDDIGRYAIVSQEVPLLAVLPYAGSAAVAGRLATAFRHADLEEARTLWSEQTSSMCRVVIPLTAALIWLAPTVVPLAVDSTDRVHIIVFILFTVITLHRVAEYGVLLRAAGRPRATLAAALVLLTGNTVFAGLGAWQWGAVGAAAGTLAANVVAWIWVLRRIAVVLDTRVGAAFPWRLWTSTVITSAVAIAAASLVGTAIDHRIGRLSLGALTFAVVVVGADLAARRPDRTAVASAGAA